MRKNSGGTAGKHNFESANQAAEADAGDKLRKYIAEIAQAAVTQEEQANNIRDSSKATSNAMALQLKTMSEQIAQLTKKLDNKENNGGGGGGSDGGGSGGRGGGGGLHDRGRGRVVQYYHAVAGFSNQTVVAQGHQKQTICIMAGPHMGGGQQELPRVRRDIKRPRAQDEERITIDKKRHPKSTTKKKSKKL